MQHTTKANIKLTAEEIKSELAALRLTGRGAPKTIAGSTVISSRGLFYINGVASRPTVQLAAEYIESKQ